jgi:hypothetical protein
VHSSSPPKQHSATLKEIAEDGKTDISVKNDETTLRKGLKVWGASEGKA